MRPSIPYPSCNDFPWKKQQGMVLVVRVQTRLFVNGIAWRQKRFTAYQLVCNEKYMSFQVPGLSEMDVVSSGSEDPVDKVATLHEWCHVYNVVVGQISCSIGSEFGVVTRFGRFTARQTPRDIAAMMV